MRINDKIKLYRLARHYNISTTRTPEEITKEVMAKAHHIAEEDMETLGVILSRLPDEMAMRCARDSHFPSIISRFLEVSGMPRTRALAFLKLGIPVRGVVLPASVRRRLSVVVSAVGGEVFLDGQHVDLRGITLLEREALHEAIGQ